MTPTRPELIPVGSVPRIWRSLPIIKQSALMGMATFGAARTGQITPAEARERLARILPKAEAERLAEFIERNER